jgi:hypothetical protein
LSQHQRVNESLFLSLVFFQSHIAYINAPLKLFQKKHHTRR